MRKYAKTEQGHQENKAEKSLKPTANRLLRQAGYGTNGQELLSLVGRKQKQRKQVQKRAIWQHHSEPNASKYIVARLEEQDYQHMRSIRNEVLAAKE